MSTHRTFADWIGPEVDTYLDAGGQALMLARAIDKLALPGLTYGDRAGLLVDALSMCDPRVRLSFAQALVCFKQLGVPVPDHLWDIR